MYLEKNCINKLNTIHFVENLEKNDISQIKKKIFKYESAILELCKSLMLFYEY